MPVKYIPYVPATIAGQAILDNITRTRRVLRYQGNDAVYRDLRRGLPLYELAKTETLGTASDNLFIRGECLSACAYLKDNNIALDLVYIDPPFASGADYAKSVYLRRHPHKAQQIADAEQELELDELRAFEEKMYGDIWNKEDYLNWMFENLTAIKAVMSETASIYVHLDWHIGHYVKVLMDEVFGEDNFKSQIIWQRVTGHMDTQGFGFNHDMILLYSKGLTNVWNVQYIAYDEKYLRTHYLNKDADGRRYELDQISAAGKGVAKHFFGKLLEPPSGTHWRYSQVKIDALINDGKIVMEEGQRPRLKRYLDEQQGKSVQSIWTDIHPVNSQAKEDTEYSTQKPEALLKRIIQASSNNGMVVADFFGGSGVTAKVAHDLGRKFIHVDVGVNSIQTARDRLAAAGAAFTTLDILDGVSLFRNPAQTMDKLKTLITGLKNEDGLDEFWEGAIQDSKLGAVPVYLPNLLDHQTKVLDVPLMNRVIQEALPDLPESIKKAIVYYVDIYDRPAVDKHIKEHNATDIQIELRDLKELLDEVVLNDMVEFDSHAIEGGFEVEIKSLASDRLQASINEYNQKKDLTGKAKASLLEEDTHDPDAPPTKTAFKPIQISEDGLELIEWVSLDCTQAEGPWHSDTEIKIDKKGFVILDSKKTKTFWNGKITSKQKPLRLKIRNIAGDETVFSL